MSKVFTRVIFFFTIFFMFIAVFLVIVVGKHFEVKDNSTFFNNYSDEAIEASKQVSSVILDISDKIENTPMWGERSKLLYKNNSDVYAQAIVIDGVLVVKHYNKGVEQYKVYWENVVMSSQDKLDVTWLSENTFILDLGTIVQGDYPFTTTFLCSFEQEPFIYNLSDTMFNYNLNYVPSSDASSAIYTRGFSDFIYQDFWKVIRTGNVNDIVEWQVQGDISLEVSNYFDIDNVITLEGSETIYDLRDSSNPIYYSDSLDYYAGTRGEELNTSDVYDYIEIYGIDDLKESIFSYAKTVYETTYNVLKQDWIALLQQAFPVLGDIISIGDNVNSVIDNIDNIIDELTPNEFITFVISLNKELDESIVMNSLEDSQAYLMEESMYKFLIDQVPSYYWKIINQYDAEFNFSVGYEDEVIYLYTSLEKDEYLAFDIYNNELFIKH